MFTDLTEPFVLLSTGTITVSKADKIYAIIELRLKWRKTEKEEATAFIAACQLDTGTFQLAL